MYQLIIAEKPSVAQSIAAVLGAKRRETGYLEGGGYLVSWCFGHLAELASAETYNEAYAKWRYDDLPIVAWDTWYPRWMLAAMTSISGNGAMMIFPSCRFRGAGKSAAISGCSLRF